MHIIIIIAFRKDHLRDIKLLQRSEMKEATNFFTKITSERDTQEKKFESERQVNILISYPTQPFILTAGAGGTLPY